MAIDSATERNRILSLDDEPFLRYCTMTAARGVGPGGQKRNRIESAVRLVFADTGIQAGCDKTRSQHQNRALALRELRLRIALTLRFSHDVEVPAWREPPPARRPEFALWVAGVLDVLAAHGWRVSEAARVFSVSTNHFTKVLLGDARVLREINRQRVSLNLQQLH